MISKNVIKMIALSLSSGLLVACGNKVLLQDATSTPVPPTAVVKSGDILIVSGGSVAAGVAPYPLHQVARFDSTGNYLGNIYQASAGSFLMGMALVSSPWRIFLPVDTIDRIDVVNLESGAIGYQLIDANLTGANMRAVETLSDGGIIVAESTTSIEKYTAAGVRVTAGFPITAVNTVTNLRRISGNRFIALGTLGTDNPRVYNNAGVLQATVPTSGSTGCAANCDPYDMIELPDGRFVATFQAATHRSLELFSASFGYVGQLYKNSAVLQAPSSLALKKNGNILACDTIYNVCEEFTISGNVAQRVGSVPLISDAAMRQPVNVVVVP